MDDPYRQMLMQIEYANLMEQHNARGDSDWDDRSFHPYVKPNMIPEAPRLDFYNGRNL